MSLQTWGFRIGVATEPDQAVGGVQFDLGEIVRRLHLEPNLELGVGDDHTVLSGTVPVHYRFDAGAANVEPFAGGGVALAYIDRDLPRRSRGDDQDVEIALKLIGGLDWPLSSGRRFRLELDLHAGDIYDAQMMASWSF
jgi:hypothetical protein